MQGYAPAAFAGGLAEPALDKPVDNNDGTYKSPNWVAQAAGSSPASVSGAVSAYDPVHKQVVLFGGTNGSTYSSQTWVWSPSSTSWTQVTPATVPDPNAGAALVWDDELGELVMVGGYLGSASPAVDSAQMWAWSGTNWLALTLPATHPSARTGASVAYDPDLGGLVLFGGETHSGSTTTSLNDTWLYKGGVWSQIQANGASGAPAARAFATMAFSTSTHQLVLFGGSETSATYGADTWTLGTSSWTHLSPAASPPGRYYAAMAYDPGLGGIVLTAGVGSTGSLNDTWAWTGQTWLKAASGAGAPAAQVAAPVAATTTGQLVLAGTNSGTPTTYVYDTNLPLLSETITHLGATNPVFYTGDTVQVTFTAQNVGAQPIDQTSVPTITGSFATAQGPVLQTAGSVLSWTTLAAATASNPNPQAVTGVVPTCAVPPASPTTTFCGAASQLAGSSLSATPTVSISNYSIAPGELDTGQFLATVANTATAGCVVQQLPILASSAFGGGDQGLAPMTVCGGGLGMEKWWSYHKTDLGDGASAAVNVANGNLVVKQTDGTDIPSHGRLGFELGRAYNSQDDMSTPGPLGAGWQFDLGAADDDLGLGLDVGHLQLPTMPLAGQSIGDKLLSPITSPLSVTYIDRDGTRFVFGLHGASANATLGNTIDLNSAIDGQGKTIKSLLGGDGTTLPFPVSGTTAPINASTPGKAYTDLCVDATYTPPPGADMYLWRYVGLTTSSGSCAGASSNNLVTVGWSIMRPDRLRYDFDLLGRLKDVVDPSGNELVYQLDTTVGDPGFGWPQRVYSNRCDPTTAGGNACPSYTLTYPTDSTVSNRRLTIVKDPAGRTTTYVIDTVNGVPELTQVWNPGNPYSTDSHATPSNTYTYSTGAGPTGRCTGSDTSATSVGMLCSATDPNGGTTRFAYQAPPSLLAAGLPTGLPSGPDRVMTVTDRAINDPHATSASPGEETLFTYNDAQATVYADDASQAQFGSATPPTGCNNSTSCERTTYSSIDPAGRVAMIQQGDALNSNPHVSHQEAFFWDGPSPTYVGYCQWPNDAFDNDLCETITRGAPSPASFDPDTFTSDGPTPDQAVRYVYNDLGAPIRKWTAAKSGGWSNANSDITTWGDHEQVVEGNGTTMVWNNYVNGAGRVEPEEPVTTGYRDVVLANNPSAYYRLGELADPSGATLADSAAGSHNPLTATTGNDALPGVYGKVPGDTALGEALNGYTASATNPQGFPDLTSSAKGSAFTLEAWMQTTSTAGEAALQYGDQTTNYNKRILFGRLAGGYVYLAIQSDVANGKLIRVQSSSPVTGPNYNLIDFTYSAATGTANDVKLYINGQPAGTTIVNNTLTSLAGGSGDTFRELVARNTDTQAGSSNLDELAVYPSVLPATVTGTNLTGPPAYASIAGHAAAASGNVRTDAGTLYALTDRTEMLTARGNDPDNVRSWGDYLTTYKRDVPTSTTSISPNQVNGTSGVCGSGATPGNTGLLCRTDTPAAADVPAGNCTTSPANNAYDGPAPTADGYAHTCATYTYDQFGQKTARTSALANSRGSTAATTYSYYAEGTSTGQDPSTCPGSDCDVTGKVIGTGWLKAVTDPNGKSVIYAYDAAGNVARTWDRDATDGHTLGEAWNSATSPPSTQYTEVDHANPVTSASLSVSNTAAVLAQPDGTVSGSGQNAAGELGNGTTTASTTPVTAKYLSNVVQVAQSGNGVNSGCASTFAVTGSGALYEWGSINGQHAPTQISTLTKAPILSVSAGGCHVLALDNTGQLWAWGDNSHGQVGNGTSGNNVSTPYPVLGGVSAIAAGGYHSLAVMTDGTVKAWGQNSHGELGTGNTSDQSSPTAVSGPSTFPGILAVSAGLYTSYAIGRNGTVWSWGDNTTGALGQGDGQGSTKTTPGQITQLGAGTSAGPVREIAGAANGAAALMSDGSVQAWGSGASNNTSPTTIISTTTAREAAIAAGWNTYLAADAAGRVNIWGATGNGQRGDGTSPSSSSPTASGSSAFTISPFATPWRDARATRDAVGNLSTNVTDLDGDTTDTRPGRGYAVDTTAFDTTSSYDADNNALMKLQPMERSTAAMGGTGQTGKPHPTTTSYDAYGNAIQSVDPNGYATVTTYDRVNRPVTVSTTRGTPTDATANGPSGITTATPCGGTSATVASSSNTGFTAAQSGHVVCTTTTGYDGNDNKVSVKDANGQVTFTAFDPAGEKIQQRGPRTTNTQPSFSLTTQWNYDNDGNVTDTCPPRQFDQLAEDNTTTTCTSTGVHSTHTAYDRAGNKVSSTIYRTTTAETTTMGYDADGNMTTSTDPLGSTTKTTYDLLDRKTGQTVPRTSASDTETTTWAYDAAGNVTAVSAPSTSTSQNAAASITAYTYDSDERLQDTVTGSVSTDPTNETPDGQGRFNERTRRVYDADGNVTATVPTQAFSSATAFTMDTVGRTDYDLDDNPAVVYDPRYNSSSATDVHPPSNGDAHTNTDQQTSQCTTSTQPDFVPGLSTYPTGPTGEGVCLTRTSYDADGNKLKQTLPTSTSSSDNRYLTWTYTDDDLKRTTTNPNPASSGSRATDTYWYDGVGRQVLHQDPNGNQDVTDYTADGLTNDTKVSGYAGTRETDYVYDADGNQTQVTDPNGDTTSTAWTTDGHKAQIMKSSPATLLANQQTTNYDYDANGNTVLVASPNETASHTGAVPQNTETVNLFTKDNLLAATLTYVASGATYPYRLIKYTYTPSGQKAQTDIGRCKGPFTPTPSTTDLPDLTNANTFVTNCPAASSTGWSQRAITTYGYAPDGLALVQRGTPATDAANNSSSASEIATTYDQAERPHTQVDTEPASGPSGSAPATTTTVTATYYLDGLDRAVTETNDTTSPSVTVNDNSYAYDGSGNVTVRSDNAAFTGNTKKYTSYAYNDAGLVQQEASDVDTSGTSTYFTYDDGGRQYERINHSGYSTPADTNTDINQTVVTTYNGDDTVRQTSDITGGYNATTNATPYSNPSTWVPGDNKPSGNANSQANGNVTVQYSYQYDRDANITNQKMEGSLYGSGTSETNSYTYNGLNNLASYTHNGTAQYYDWDNDNNRLDIYTKDAQGNKTYSPKWTYNYDDSLATKISGGSTLPYNYDNAGDLTKLDCTTYTYDGFQRSTSDKSSCSGSTVTTSYVNDALNRHIQTSVASTGTSTSSTVTSSYDGLTSNAVGQDGILDRLSHAADVTYELAPDGTPLLDTQTGADATTTLINTDGQGNTANLQTETSTSLTCATNYTPFGTFVAPTAGTNCTGTGSHALNQLWWHASQQEPSTSTYQFGARTYDPNAASFTTSDKYQTSTSDDDVAVGSDPLTRNTYAYVNGNPLNFDDPDGHMQAIVGGGGPGSQTTSPDPGLKHLLLPTHGQSPTKYPEVRAALIGSRWGSVLGALLHQAKVRVFQQDFMHPTLTLDHDALWKCSTIGCVERLYQNSLQSAPMLQDGLNRIGTLIDFEASWYLETAELSSDLTAVSGLGSLAKFGLGKLVGRLGLNRLYTSSGRAVFWTGLGKDGENVAKGWVAKNGGTTLETTMEGRGIEMPDFVPGDYESEKAWQTMSRKFAQGARGDVTVLSARPFDATANSTFSGVEYPALIRNKNVSSITMVNPTTGDVNVIWMR